MREALERHHAPKTIPKKPQRRRSSRFFTRSASGGGTGGVHRRTNTMQHAMSIALDAGMRKSLDLEELEALTDTFDECMAQLLPSLALLQHHPGFAIT